MNLFDKVLIDPILNLLIVFYSQLTSLGIPGALGFAIIIMTVAVRLALWPLTTAQLKSSKKMAELKPHLAKIKETHGKDKARHQQEVSRLYKEHGVNPLSGCLPLVLQIPIFIALYQVLLKFVSLNNSDLLVNINDRIYLESLKLSSIPDPNFFGINLSSKPNEWAQIGVLILTVPLLTGVLQFFQSKMLLAPEDNSIKQNKPKNKKKDEGLEDTMGQMQSQMAFIMPAMIAFFSYGFPIGLSIYWNTFTIIGIVQQYKIMGAGALNKYLPQKWQK